MQRILFTCPSSGRTVPTVQRMTAAKFSTMAGRYAFRCSSCNEVHHWRKEDAWLEEDSPRASS